jgi:hypothetical protein
MSGHRAEGARTRTNEVTRSLLAVCDRGPLSVAVVVIISLPVGPRLLAAVPYQ